MKNEKYKPNNYEDTILNSVMFLLTNLGKYVGLIIGVDGIIDKNLFEVEMGGATYFISEAINQSINHQHRSDSFSTLEKTIVDEINVRGNENETKKTN